MKLSFSNLSIRIKVIVLIVFISSITLIISAFLFFLYDRSEFKSKSLRDLTILAEVIGNNNTANLAFNTKKDAQKVLNSLSAENQIKYAVIFNKEGHKFVEYSAPGLLKTPEIDLQKFPSGGFQFYKNSLVIYKNIYLDKELLGKIYLYNTLEEYNKRFNKFVNYLLLLLFYTILGIMAFSVLLTKLISKPIIKLSELMNDVSDKRDYSLRIEKTSNDEVGKLCEGFNHMLNEIETQNVALHNAKIEAQKADSLKSVFLSNMSHEIRTPLNAIIGFTDLILNKPLQEKDKTDYINYINSSSKLLLQLINDIIDFAKIESGQLKINPTETPVDYILGEIYSSFQNDLKLKGKANIELRLVKECNNMIIKTDQLRFKQILNNLINNAIKFTNQGFIEFGYNSSDSKQVLFYVKDSGIGISKNNLGMIFERFKQAMDNSSDIYGGTGLGLSISKNLVEMLGGKIWAESELDKGSTFYFSVPI